MVYRLFNVLLRPLLKIPAINDFLRQKARHFWDHIKSPAPDWSSLDLWVVRQFDGRVLGSSVFSMTPLKVYELRAFEWAVKMFRDSPSMIPHLQNVLETILPSVAMSAILGRWDRTMWGIVSNGGVELALRFPYPNIWDPPNPTIRHAVLQQPEGINFLFHHQYWVKTATQHSPDDNLDDLLDSLMHTTLQHSTGLRFVIPFSVVDALWTHENSTIRAKSLDLLSLFEESWKPYPGYDEVRHNGERQAFMQALASHIIKKDRISALLTSERGQAFICYIHDEAITRRLIHNIPDWPLVIEKAKEVGGLTSNYFAPIPKFGVYHPSTLPNLDPTRSYIETERDVQVDNDQVLDIVTSNGMGDTSRVSSLKGSPTRHTQNLGAHSVDINANTSLGTRSVDNVIEDTERPTDNLGDFVADDDGNRIHKDNTHGDTMRGVGPAKQTRTSILGDLTGESSDIAGLRRHTSNT